MFTSNRCTYRTRNTLLKLNFSQTNQLLIAQITQIQWVCTRERKRKAIEENLTVVYHHSIYIIYMHVAAPHTCIIYAFKFCRVQDRYDHIQCDLKKPLVFSCFIYGWTIIINTNNYSLLLSTRCQFNIHLSSPIDII